MFRTEKEARTLQVAAPRTFVSLSLALLALLDGCGSDSAMLGVPTGKVTFLAVNNLIAPVTISVDGSPYVILSNGRTTQITLPASTQLTWTSAKPADAEGQMIPDEIGVEHVDVGSISGTFEITNVIGNQTYFTARIFNFTNLRVSIAVWDGTKVWCAAVLPAATQTAPGFTLIGYYRLLSTTDLRAYATTTNCTGSFVSWPSSQLTGLEPKSGMLTLSLEPTS